MTTNGLIGAGHMGRNFSIAAIERGYDIVISNPQGPQTLTDLVNELGPKTRAATAADAAAAGDFALVAIPLAGVQAVPAEPLGARSCLQPTTTSPSGTATTPTSTPGG